MVLEQNEYASPLQLVSYIPVQYTQLLRPQNVSVVIFKAFLQYCIIYMYLKDWKNFNIFI